MNRPDAPSIRAISVRDPALLEGSAETFYRHLSWQRIGEVPGHAANPQGELHATAIYFKQLEP
jgi:hypothetical protein